MSARGMQVDVSDVPVAVSSLRVEFNGGSGYTNESFARGLMSGIFAAKDFSGLTEAIRQGEKDLTGLGLYRTVDINLRRSSKRLCPEVILKLDEKRRPFMKAGISLSSETAEPTLEVAGTMRNLFGNAESLNAQVNFGNKETGSVKLTFQKPKIFDSPKRFEAPYGTFTSTMSYSGGVKCASFLESHLGMLFKVTSESTRHQALYSVTWRDTKPLPNPEDSKKRRKKKKKKLLSNSVLAACKPSLKSAVQYTFTNNTTDSTWVPTRGVYSRFFAELAGLGGDVSHVKMEATSRGYVPLTPHLSVGLGGFAGLLVSTEGFKLFGGETYLNDRFFLKGVRDLRMRGFKEFGPMDEADALGGDAYFTLGAHVSYSPPIPILRNNGLRLHAFANCGNMCLLNEESGFGGLSKLWGNDVRTSAGFGMVAPTPCGRFELNCIQSIDGKPLHMQLLWAIDTDFI
ncbi:hypothetical protein AAMO2058_001577300 [Amorphochlora amoebiformis]